MSKNENTGTQEQDQAAEQADAPQEETAKPDTDWKAEARKWEARAKQNLSDLDQTRNDLNAAQTAAEEAKQAIEDRDRQIATVSALRTKEALLVDAGLPRDLADNVVGDDEQAWQASVERFAALRGSERAPRSPNPAQTADTPTPSKDDAARSFFGL